MNELLIRTSKQKEIIDLTEKINKIISEQQESKELCNVFVKHTTCGIALTEFEPGIELDFLDAIEVMFPKLEYRHAHNPGHVGEHIMSSIIGQSVTVPVRSSKLDLGTWQSVVLIELSGPRDRKLSVTFF